MGRAEQTTACWLWCAAERLAPDNTVLQCCCIMHALGPSHDSTQCALPPSCFTGPTLPPLSHTRLLLFDPQYTSAQSYHAMQQAAASVVLAGHTERLAAVKVSQQAQVRPAQHGLLTCLARWQARSGELRIS